VGSDYNYEKPLSQVSRYHSRESGLEPSRRGLQIIVQLSQSYGITNEILCLDMSNFIAQYSSLVADSHLLSRLYISPLITP
jgi:hypothetical protein